MHVKVESVFELYALALAIGQRFANQYRDAALNMRTAGDEEAADLLDTIEDLECAQALQIDRWTCGAHLPRVDVQRFFTPGEPRLRASASREQVLESAIRAELALRSCYVRLAADSPDEEIRALAAALASERDRHVWRVRRMLSRPAEMPACTLGLHGAAAFTVSRVPVEPMAT